MGRNLHLKSPSLNKIGYGLLLTTTLYSEKRKSAVLGKNGVECTYVDASRICYFCHQKKLTDFSLYSK